MTSKVWSGPTVKIFKWNKKICNFFQNLIFWVCPNSGPDKPQPSLRKFNMPLMSGHKCGKIYELVYKLFSFNVIPVFCGITWFPSTDHMKQKWGSMLRYKSLHNNIKFQVLVSIVLNQWLHFGFWTGHKSVFQP